MLCEAVRAALLSVHICTFLRFQTEWRLYTYHISIYCIIVVYLPRGFNYALTSPADVISCSCQFPYFTSICVSIAGC